MPWKEVTPQLKHPRYDGGCDYEVERPVLMQKGTKVVEYRPGHTSWYKVGETKYFPGRLILWNTKSEHMSFPAPEVLLFNGRVTKAKLKAAGAKIADYLGVPVDQLPALSRNKTFVWGK